MEKSALYRISATTLCLLLITGGAECAKNTVCYFTNWSQYRSGLARYVPTTVDPFVCTHLVYAFAQIESLYNFNIATYEWNDNTRWREFTNLKTTNRNLKTFLAVGGYTHGTDRFTAMARTAAGREQFITSAIITLRNNNFDGLDIDWEYPGDTDAGNDKEYFSLLLKEMRTRFEEEATTTGRPRLLMAAAVTAGIEKASIAYDVPELDKYLDIISVMTYDYHGTWERVTGLSTPLNAPDGDTLSVVDTMQWYLAQGASRAKLHLGVASYAHSWTLDSITATYVGAPASTAGNAGEYTKARGTLAIYEVCSLLNHGYTTVFDPIGQTNYAYLGNQWITYETVDTVTTKANYLIQEDFGGVMVWALDLDDFTGQFCSWSDSPYPIIYQVSRQMQSAPASTTPATADPTLSSTTTTTESTTTTSTTTPSTTSTTTTTTTTTTPSSGVVTKDPQNAMINNGDSSEKDVDILVPRSGFECPDSGSPYYFEDPEDCNRFYVCVMGLAIQSMCPTSTNYNPNTKTCAEGTSFCGK